MLAALAVAADMISAAAAVVAADCLAADCDSETLAGVAPDYLIEAADSGFVPPAGRVAVGRRLELSGIWDSARSASG